MAPQSCVMNPAQGSPPSVAAEESTAEDKKPDGSEELDLSPVRRCKNKTPKLPFSVESLISERTPERSRFPPGRRQGCVLSEGTECSSPRGLYQSNPETAELRDKEVDHWSHTAHTSPPSEYGSLFVSLFFSYCTHIFCSTFILVLEICPKHLLRSNCIILNYAYRLSSFSSLLHFYQL